jgi:ubiquinone/menaquinone biosynthesis C-methylase UbiE
MGFMNAGFGHRLVDTIFSNWLISFLYKKYIYGLGLEGGEDVLDFGSGSGAGSRHFAQILSEKGGQLTCLDTSRPWMKTAMKRLKKYSKVRFITDDIRNADIPDQSFDVISIHIMLHDIDKGDRPEIVRALAASLRNGGKLFIREPINHSHGMPADEIRILMTQNGLRETGFEISKFIFVGPVYAGRFVKE